MFLLHFDRLSVTKDFKLNVSLSQPVLSLSKACSEPVEEGRLTKNLPKFLSSFSSRFDKLSVTICLNFNVSVTKDFKFNVSLSSIEGWRKTFQNFWAVFSSRFDKLSVTICLNFNVSVTKDFKFNVSLSQLVLSLSKGRLTKTVQIFLAFFCHTSTSSAWQYV